MIEATESLLPACKPRWKETFRKICFFLKKVFTKPETCGMILFVRERRKRERIEYGALAQLVERTNSNASPLLILYQKAVNVKSAQNLTGIFGAIAQLVARYIRIVEVRGSNPLSSTKSKEVEPIKWFGFFLWHGYCAPCFTTGKFIEEAAAVVDDRLAALLEKS